MRVRNVKRLARRAAYTLIELLVVMAIIAVLVGLLLSGVMAVLNAKDRAGNRADIAKLDSSLGSALATKYNGAKHLPGKLVLWNDVNVYVTNANLPPAQQDLDTRISADALKKMFGSNFIRKGGNPNVVAGSRIVPWDGTTNANGKVVLEGHQCLVFYLGGFPVTSGNAVRMTGFSSDITNPWQAPKVQTPPEERIGPYYEFESNRLALWNGAKFFSYLDRYGVPFAYFGGTGSSNTHISFCPSLGGAFCPNSPTTGPLAYQDPTGNFANPETYQIVSPARTRSSGRAAPRGVRRPAAATPTRRTTLGISAAAPLAPPRTKCRGDPMRTTKRRRGGFTLIELLVVIAIIAVMMALTTAAVIRFRETAVRSSTNTSLTKVSSAMRTQWTAVREQAEKETMDTKISGGASVPRAQYVALRQAQVFPMALQEIFAPGAGDPQVPLSAYVTFLKNEYGITALNYSTVPAESQRAICALMIVQVGSKNSALSADDLGPAVGQVPLGATLNRSGQGLVDGWRRPVLFTRQYNNTFASIALLSAGRDAQFGVADYASFTINNPTQASDNVLVTAQ